MAKGYVLYNPLAGDKCGDEDAKLLQYVLEEPLEFFDITRITNYTAFLSGLESDDYLVLMGGDGTLNRFVNDTRGLSIAREILYFPTGTGNDFAADLGHEAFDPPFSVAPYLKDLPTVEVKGKTYRFLNGVGFGLDGYCCQEGDRRRKSTGKRINYGLIAVQGLLFRFEPRNARITVDGKVYEYENVWIAPTMHGRYYGGGMMPAPGQDRTSGVLSLMVFHGAGRLRTLCVFPGIFSGRHVKHTNLVAIHQGSEITVEFDRPTPLQMDGETVLNVTSYTARIPQGSGNRKEAL